MNRNDLIAFYKSRVDEFHILLSAVNKKINWVSNLRLISALILIGIIYYAFTNPTILLPGILMLLIFVALVKRHSKLFSRKTHLENLISINMTEMAALNGNMTALATGAEFIDQHHPYTHDLDIFGSGSLFQAINRCNTTGGKKELAGLLSKHMASASAIISNQQAIKELSDRTELRHDFQAAGMEIDELPLDRAELLDWLSIPSFVYAKPSLLFALWALPVVTIVALIAVSFLHVPTLIVLTPVVLQWSITSVYSKRIQSFHEYISRKKNILEKYAHILKMIQPENFESANMKEIKAKASEADLKVSKLASLVSAMNARLNSYTWLFVNSFLLYDIWCVYRLEEWKANNAANLKSWLDAISETEVLCSIGNFAFNNPSFVYPLIHENLSIEADGLGHPLVPVEECKTNDVSIGRQASILIITGANMAGKSTFLRTMGVNLVIALAGGPVFARSFRCPLIPIRSGMRTADSLKDHESYFYAELNRLKSIMDELRAGRPLFILLDEILKGTNSGDKQKGSISLVRQLLLNPCLALIATHDLALGELEHEYDGKVMNYCFEANIENDQLSFDYTLKPGLAQTMNATFLMRKMGIIPASNQ